MRPLLALLAVLLAAPAHAQVAKATLDNGLRIVVVTDRLAPVVAVALNYLTGSNDSPEGFPGTAHALEHMMFRGAQDLSRDQLSELGGILGGNYNASTAETLTQYTFTVPAADLPLVLRIEAGRMTGATITAPDWTNERGAINQEVSRNLSSPIFNLFAAIQQSLFDGTPYQHTALGTRPSFDATDAPLLRAFYDRWYVPNNAILVIAGDVDGPATIEAARKAFAAIQARPLPARAPIALPAPTPRAISLPSTLPTGLAALAVRMPGLRSPDFAAADILADVIGSGRAPLAKLVTDGKLLAARFSYQPKAEAGIGIAFATIPANADPGPALAELRAILEATARGDIPPDLVEAAKRQELAQIAAEADSIAGLARAWSQAIAVAGLDSPDDFAKAYAAVTPDDVARVARTWLDTAAATTAVLTPARTGAPPAAASFGAPETHTAEPGPRVALPGWATQALANTTPPTPDLPPDAVTLPNGLRLIVIPQNVGHSISMFAQVNQVTGLQQPPGQEGVSELTDHLMAEGSATLDRLGLAKRMDDLAARPETGFNFSLKTPTPAFEQAMGLLADAELHPAFPEPAFLIARAQMAQSLEGRLASPAYAARKAREAALLPANDPALREATPQSIRALSQDDVRAYHQAAFRPDRTTMVIAGDITPADARRIALATFGAWVAPNTPPPPDLPPVPPNPPAQVRVPDNARLQDQVTLVQTLQMPLDDPDRYALLLGNDILGGDSASRLYNDLRVQSGTVYTVFSAMTWSRTRATTQVDLGADPANLQRTRDLIRQNILRLQSEPVSAPELARAKARSLRRLPMQRASIDGAAALYLRLADLGLPLDTPQKTAARLEAVTPAQIQAAFAKWVRPDAMAEIVQGPPLAAVPTPPAARP